MKTFYTFLTISVLFISLELSYAEINCNYTSQIEECRDANKNGTTLSIKNFLCVSEINDERMIYNIILDDKFKKIDKDADNYLKSLEENKNLCFGSEKEMTFLECIDIIYLEFGKYGNFHKEYIDTLYEVRKEAVSCLGGKTSIVEVKNKFESSNQVNNLIEDKNSRRQKVAIDILILNKQHIRNNSNKKFMQIRRTMYDSVSNLFMINTGYLMRIMFKWASKTKNPY